MFVSYHAAAGGYRPKVRVEVVCKALMLELQIQKSAIDSPKNDHFGGPPPAGGVVPVATQLLNISTSPS